MNQQDLKNSPEDLNFEQAMQELERIVRQLEEGRVPLEEAIGAYERGVILKKRCEALLSDARMKIEEIIVQPDGTLTTKPSELEQFVKNE
jgi:exodeoxyribonuclease VII small subunit